MKTYQLQSLQRMDWRFSNKLYVKTVLHLKPFSAISAFQRRELQNQNN
jgi:hypothetical protein